MVRGQLASDLAGRLILRFAAREHDSFEYLADKQVSLSGCQTTADDQIVDTQAEHSR